MMENLDRPLAATDPEAGWCWRADSNKWDLMAGQKYFEGDMHRGLNGSRKPVEILPGDFAVNAVRGKWSKYALTINPGQMNPLDTWLLQEMEAGNATGVGSKVKACTKFFKSAQILPLPSLSSWCIQCGCVAGAPGSSALRLMSS